MTGFNQLNPQLLPCGVLLQGQNTTEDPQGKKEKNLTREYKWDIYDLIAELNGIDPNARNAAKKATREE